MALTPAERRRRHRQRVFQEGNDALLSMTVSAHAKAALDRLARHQRQTRRHIIEQLLIQAESTTVADLAQPENYYDP